MTDLKISEMQNMQRDLWEKTEQVRGPMKPEYGRNFLLWMIEEMGEAIAIIKKKGETKIMSSDAVRKAFIEEMSDILMYYNNALLSYDISAEEISSAYLEKHNRNMNRDFSLEHANYLESNNESVIE